MSRRSLPWLIIIAGSGRKVGKTHMATAIIREFSEQFPLLALKISPHVHYSAGNSIQSATSVGFRIFRELEPHNKNSGQFLSAGAMQSYFIETGDAGLHEAFEIFIRECNPSGYPVICESGALSNLVKPAILIFITHSADIFPEGKHEIMARADIILPAQSFDPYVILQRISYTDQRWELAAGKEN